MKTEETNRPSGNIGVKVLIAISLSIVFLAAAIYITRQTFSKVNQTISELSEPDDKTEFLNSLYGYYGYFERNYQSPLLANPSAPTEDYFLTLDTLKALIDSTSRDFKFNASEITVLDSISAMVGEQHKKLLTFRIVKENQQPLLAKNLDSLVNLINAERVVTQPDVVTTRKSTRRIPAEVEAQRETEPEKEDKKGFFQRIFSGEDQTKAEPDETLQQKPDIIEETYIRVDTLPLAKSDTSKAKAGKLIKNIEQKQALYQRQIRNIELQILQLGGRIQKFMLSLIQNSEEKELARIYNQSNIAETMMQNAISRMYLVFGIFAILATALVLRILSDLSKARYYRRQLVDEKERAENLSKVKERFLANMSHEIRTPLQNISGYSERLVDNFENPDAEIIHQSSNHLLQIVNQVLDFSRISTGKLALHPEVFKISEVTEEVLESMKIQATKKNIRLLHESALEEDEVYADSFRIRQILYNLLGNAIKFTADGFVKFTTRSRRKNERILFEFTVEDTGIGIDEEEIERLFEEFEQADMPNHATTGTGLGLSIVKALVEAYQGKISAKSEKGEGSIFEVELELDEVPEEVIDAGSIAGLPPVKSVLLVDDDISILNFTRDVLNEKLIDVSATASPLEALEYAKKRTFDVALVDYRMPEMTGAELCEELKKMHPSLPVIAVTANIIQAKPDKDVDSPFDGYFPKPFKSGELLELLGLAEQIPPGNGEQSRMEKKLDTITMGDREMLDELLEQFQKDCSEDLKEIEKALAANDLSTLRERVHRLSGRLGFFEFQQLAAVFQDIEADLDRNSYNSESAQRLVTGVENLRVKLARL